MNWRGVAREAMGIGAVALLVALWVLRARELDFSAPVLYEWDALFNLAYIETLRERGWLFWNERLAAPFGQDVRDFPLGGENLHWLALKALGMVMPNAAATATAYLLLTYVLVAMTTYVVARLLRLRRGPAAVVALLFAFLPFHQMRWTMHLLRVGYYPVPLAGLAILWMLDWQRELREQPSAQPARWRASRVVFVLASAVLLGSSDTQNTLYAALLLLPLTLLVALRDRDLRPLLLAFVFSVTAAGALLANNLPYLMARAERGRNPDVLARTPGEQESFGLRLAQLVLPVENHRVPQFARAVAAAQRWLPTDHGEHGQALGAFGTLGFGIGLAAVGSAALGRTLLPHAPLPIARLGLLMITGVLWASVGGFSYLLSVAGLTNYRTWNRMSLWIALFALLATGSVLQRTLDRIASRRLAALLMVTVLVIGLLDQMPAKIPFFDPAQLARQWHADAAFFAQVEAALPPRAMVYQFPARVFPEAGRVFALGDHEHVKPYLHTAALRFSYGGMKGRREGTWWRALDSGGPEAATALLALGGFDAALVERRGYADAGAEHERAMASVGAVRVLVDPAGERALWDLRPVRERLGGASGPQTAAGRAVFDSVAPQFDHSFYTDEPAAGLRWRWTHGSDAEIYIPGGDAPPRRRCRHPRSHRPAARAVTVAAAGTTHTVSIADGPGTFGAVLDVPADGTTRISSQTESRGNRRAIRGSSPSSSMIWW
jgi:phosphoglycerol transferase